MLYRFNTAPLPPHYQNWLVEAWEESFFPLLYIQFLFVLCISERRKKKKSVLVLEEKAIFLGKQGGPKDYVCSEKIDFHN